MSWFDDMREEEEAAAWEAYEAAQAEREMRERITELREEDEARANTDQFGEKRC